MRGLTRLGTASAFALCLAGACADIDDEDGPDMLDELDRMRHASPPGPPLEL